MKLHGWVAGVVLVGGVMFAMRGCLSKPAPDEKLAGRLEKMCTIARQNVHTPERGVLALGDYLGDHAGDVVGEFADTIATIEKIRDDKRHDDRARLARDRLVEPVRGCEEDWFHFWDAVMEDPEANALMERFFQRLSRTLDIIFPNVHFHGRDLPRQLERYLISNL
jgi:hypothetical protein